MNFAYSITVVVIGCHSSQQLVAGSSPMTLPVIYRYYYRVFINTALCTEVEILCEIPTQ